MSNLNARMVKQKRHIIVFLDNCKSHPQMKLSNVEIRFFPANTTSRLQPMDMGVIKCDKDYYRRQIANKIVEEIVLGNVKTTDEFIRDFKLLDAVFYMNNAWNTVTPTTIANCFRKAGFGNALEGDEEEEVVPNPTNRFDEIPIEFRGETTFEQFVNVDNHVTGVSTEIESEDGEVLVDTSAQQVEEEDGEEIEKPKFNEVMAAVQTLETYCKFDIEKYSKMLNNLQDVKSDVISERVKAQVQPKISEFFEKKQIF